MRNNGETRRRGSSESWESFPLCAAIKRIHILPVESERKVSAYLSMWGFFVSGSLIGLAGQTVRLTNSDSALFDSRTQRIPVSIGGTKGVVVITSSVEFFFKLIILRV